MPYPDPVTTIPLLTHTCDMEFSKVTAIGMLLHIGHDSIFFSTDANFTKQLLPLSDQKQLWTIHGQLECSLCFNESKESVYTFQCGHYFCKSCRKKLRICVICGQEMVIPGNQPAGHMTRRTDLKQSLPGYEDCGTIKIGCNFYRGIQGTAVS